MLLDLARAQVALARIVDELEDSGHPVELKIVRTEPLPGVAPERLRVRTIDV